MSTLWKTCEGEGRQGEGMGEAWRPEISTELENVGAGPDAFLETMEEVDEPLDDVGDDQGVGDPLQEDPPRRRRR